VALHLSAAPWPRPGKGTPERRNGLVLTAGGARGAYQAGVLQRIAEIPRLRERPPPFQVITGASAGAINGAFLAATGGGGFGASTLRLSRLWADLQIQEVIRTDALSLAQGGLQWLRDFSLGWLLGAGTVQALFDASPLHEMIARRLPTDAIGTSIRDGWLYALAISATSYHSGRSFIFIQGRPGHPLWQRGRRVTVATEITADHICASAAIPVVFPPVRIPTAPGSEIYFGDGALRQVTPFSPAIRLGSDRVLGIGIRSQQAAAQLLADEIPSADDTAERAQVQPPPVSQIAGVFLNALFLDHLDTDVDHLHRMNELLRHYEARPVGVSSDVPSGGALAEPMRIIEPLVLNPSEDLALVAKSLEHRMPWAVRGMLDGLGVPNAQCADLTSYLLFDSAYTRVLLDIGYRDAAARIDEIELFLRTRDEEVLPASA